MEKEQVEKIFNKLCTFAGKKVNTTIDPPQVALVTSLYDVYNRKPAFDIYINSDNGYWEDKQVVEEFNSILRGLARTARLIGSINYRIYLNTDVPERYESLVSKAKEFETELDNDVARGIANRSVKVKRSKSIDKSFHYIRDRVELHDISVLRVGTDDNISDFFTKALPPQRHKQLSLRINQRLPANLH